MKAGKAPEPGAETPQRAVAPEMLEVSAEILKPSSEAVEVVPDTSSAGNAPPAVRASHRLPEPHVHRGGVHQHHLSVHLQILDLLKQHIVGRVALLYLGVCWVILDPLHVVFHMLNVPEWANRLVIIVMALGFPVAIASAWIYEGKPAVAMPGPDAARKWRQRASRRLNRALAAVASLLVLYFLAYHFWLGKEFAEPVSEVAQGEAEGGPAGAAAPQRSIAVLPFIDMSQAHDQQYLTDGLAEELLNLLAQIPEFRVAARTSAFAFRDKAEDVSTIASKLHVAHILEGSIRKAGNHVRITAQLIRADSGYHLWSETYDRKLDDIFSLQDEIAAAVVQALKVKLLDKGLPEHVAPTNLQAYNLYLQARFAAQLHTPDGFRTAIDYLQRAIALDGNYEPLWTELSIVYGDMAARGLLPPSEAFAKCRDAVNKALALNPRSANAHVALGYLHMNDDWDWAAAEREINQALTLQPGSADVLHAAGSLDLVLGRTGDAVRQFVGALERDPLRASSYYNLGLAYFADGRMADAERAYRKTIELRPAFAYVHNQLGLVLIRRGALAEALVQMQRENNETWRLQGLALAYAAMHRARESDDALHTLIKQYQKDSPYVIATVYGFRGETESAFSWLDRALAQRDATLTGIKSDPLFANLQRDPRYSALLTKIGLTP